MRAHRLPRFQMDRYEETCFGKGLFPASPDFVGQLANERSRPGANLRRTGGERLPPLRNRSHHVDRPNLATIGDGR
jgi:hypothetical protein